ncbi:pyrroloquinoline quinone biosynthesis protein B [Pedobacter sp. AK013]|uniref:MBL fold metallo-hydrolase n=1 Tax=Pedobacter sp. AK013 TaxID=2723071 RepID=UPI0016198AA0|nr:MBL fold metallo-hydrolase [Pedobacter sp. AK013]MBB6239841.1 pyrroloquinoline quinone biosynthesis protein B [Pedobacter sp. AK013]
MRALLLFFFIGFSFQIWAQKMPASSFIMVLGVAQDGGYPHMGCQKNCCKMAWKDEKLRRNVVSLALVDPNTKKWWLFEATPDIKTQLQDFRKRTNEVYPYLPEGIFITHAHIGHYTGLMEFGREVMSTNGLKVYILPKLKSFLEQNGPWSQLVSLKNINLVELKANDPVDIAENKITAFTVPHRDEFSETAGFKIETPTKKYLFIPDIDKWNKWDKNIINEVKKVDIAMIDATFYGSTELGNRPIAEVPHPLVTETEELFGKEDRNIKNKIFLIHFNHTNPLLWDSTIQKQVLKNGFNIAKQGDIY